MTDEQGVARAHRCRCAYCGRRITMYARVCRYCRDLLQADPWYNGTL